MNFLLFTAAGVLLLCLLGFLIWKQLQVNTAYTRSDVKNVYVIRTHLWNDYVESIFLKMQAQLGAENVFLLFDETKAPIQQPHIRWNNPAGVAQGPAIITINESDCLTINKLHQIGEFTGSEHRPEAQVYACYQAIKKDYDYLWFIEYDVYSNNYKEVLGSLDGIQADILTTYTKTRRKDKRWFWWPNLIGPISETPVRHRMGCLFPINRFSKKFLSVLEQNLSKNSGFCEVYFPTLCALSGLKLKSIPTNHLGIFRYRPILSGKEFHQINQTDNRLYHPLKDMDFSTTPQKKKSA